jgi:hydrogenase maturation factor
MSCDPDRGCITCGDVAVEMRVIRVDGEGGLATCAGEAGERREVETALVGAVAPGDIVLVHADVALTRVEAGA